MRYDLLMNEQQRVAYLRSMGYQVYYPKFLLPGAKPSPHYELPEPEMANTDQSAVQRLELAPVGAKSTAKTAAARTALSDAGEDDKRMRRSSLAAENVAPVAAQNDNVSVTQRAPQSDADDLRFSLQYFAINESLAVINEIPFQMAGKQGKEIKELLSAILTALGTHSAQPQDQVLQAEQFVWPLAEGLEVMGDSRRAAGLALQGFISQRREQDEFKNLLVFTSQLPDLFSPVDGKSGEHYGDHGSVAAGYNLTVSHSLPAMLAHPQLKREVWAHLQVLRQRLN